MKLPQWTSEFLNKVKVAGLKLLDRVFESNVLMPTIATTLILFIVISGIVSIANDCTEYQTRTKEVRYTVIDKIQNGMKFQILVKDNHEKMKLIKLEQLFRLPKATSGDNLALMYMKCKPGSNQVMRVCEGNENIYLVDVKD